NAERSLRLGCGNGSCCPTAIAPNRLGRFGCKKNGHSLWMRLLFDNLVRTGEDRQRDDEAERLGGLQVDHQLESCWLNHREVRGFVAIQYSANIDPRLGDRHRQCWRRS